MDKSKINYAQAAQQVATELSQLLSRVDTLQKVWVDRGYAAGGANALTQDDLTKADGEQAMPLTDLTDLINACDQMMKFVRGSANATPGEYLKVLNRTRTDL
jgi:hypothetical protein